MTTFLESNKAKIAKRVIEVFDFFDNNCRHATVMDIVREYGRPQSSTSELMQSLVELGLLYKDAQSRSYSPTPRLATLGFWAQPEIIRNGQLFSFMDRFAAASGCGVGLFGMVGPQVQIFRWVPASVISHGRIACGAAEPLSGGVAGQLLLSTLPGDVVGLILRRLNAEAAEADKFDGPTMAREIAEMRFRDHATGLAGFGFGRSMSALLLPQKKSERPLAIGALHPADESLEGDELIDMLRSGLADLDRSAFEERPRALSMAMA